MEQAKAVAGPAGKAVALMRGATITSALRAGLLEEITVDQRPVLLGGGTRCSGSLTSACTWNVPRSR